jgi:hypothetical protein
MIRLGFDRLLKNSLQPDPLQPCRSKTDFIAALGARHHSKAAHPKKEFFSKLFSR